MSEQFEIFVVEKTFDVALGTGKKIIEAKHIRTVRQQALAQMRTEKPRSSGHQNSLLKMHCSSCLFRHTYPSDFGFGKFIGARRVPQRITRG